MLERDAYQSLLSWKKTKRKQALLVTGARQVGKTYLIREFASRQYRHFAEINLLDIRDAKAALDSARDSREIFANITLLTEAELVPGETLIFLDEVQVAKEVVTAIKFLVEREGFDYILSGSLLGTELRDIKSVPLGYLDILTMHPLSLMEFARSRGIGNVHFEQMHDCFSKRIEVPPLLHKRMLGIFYEYLIVGGMPAVVDAFNESNNLQTVRRMQQNIVALNKHDISKYNARDALTIKDVYDLIPSELNAQNKRFVLKQISEKARFSRYENTFVWLAEAGVAITTYNVDEPKYPLLLSKAANYFKLFMNDVGLLTSTFMKDAAISILAKKAGVNYGAIYENAVAQELLAAGFTLYYYRSKKLGEIDFVVETAQGTVLPIEVKSGSTIRKHAALDNVLSVKNYGIKEAFVLSDLNLETHGRVTYLPVYMAALLRHL
jgi:predicted AAA+ superfamily ATPase